MTNTVDTADDILDQYDLRQYGRGGAETKDGVVCVTMCSPSWKELTAVVSKGASREQILRAICQTIWEYDPDLDFRNGLRANGGHTSEFYPAEALGKCRDAKQWFSAKALDMMAAELNGWKKKPAQSVKMLQDAFDRIDRLRVEVCTLTKICRRTDAEPLLERAEDLLEEAQGAVGETLSVRKESERG